MAKKFSYLAIVFVCFLIVKSSLYPPLPKATNPFYLYSNQIQVDLKRVMVTAIHSARRSIFLQIYGLTDPELIALLQKKKDEGLDVKVYFDPSGSRQSLPSYATPIHCKGLMHKKILVIDEEKIFLGTANLTPSSLHFHSNVVLGIHSPLLAHHFSHSSSPGGLFNIGGIRMETYQLPDPRGVALSRLCQCLDEAKNEIRLAIFTFTHPPALFL
ncbi:MAG: Phospholipase D [Chlamydiae bacterium]|nr:Phospholipase D [Chlamydiota bacterium]